MGEVSLFTIVIALAIGYLVWRLSMGVIRMMATPPPEIDPEDVVAVDQDFRCSVCGAEVTLRVANVTEMNPPRHCREDMDPVGAV
ncbi:MAG TPA: hypothetical protein VM470_07375 [Acidimicrobiia bacterium]|nr:hypothetical protein [Acidimicrobiia bacterium]